MTDGDLIKAINIHHLGLTVIKERLNERVDYAQVEFEAQGGHEYCELAYFVNHNDECVGVLLPMFNLFGCHTEFHAYIKEAYRGQGLMTKSIHDHIKHHMFKLYGCMRATTPSDGIKDWMVREFGFSCEPVDAIRLGYPAKWALRLDDPDYDE